MAKLDQDWPQRLCISIRLLHSAMFDKGYGGEVFWPVFARQWSRCDAVSNVNEWVINLITKADRCPVKYREKFWIDLPDTIIVYRGSDRSRIVGHIAWTTVRSAAEHFATGMRGGSFPDPVIATGVIEKSKIFFASGHRESEVVCLPKIIRRPGPASKAEMPAGAMNLHRIPLPTRRGPDVPPVQLVRRRPRRQVRRLGEGSTERLRARNRSLAVVTAESGLPIRFPARRAAANASRMRVAIMSRSASATAAKMWIVNLVAVGLSTQTKSTFLSSRSQ